MSKRHILYVPWTYPGEGDEFHTKSLAWKDADDADELHYGSYNYEIVHYGDGTSLADLSWFSEIYIRGHGAPGDHTIDNDHSGTSSLKYDAVADRLISHGLKKTWVGVIKCYNCNSGRCTLGMQSFAAKFAQHMRFTKGYHLVSYVGYLGAMDSEPNQQAGEQFKHKHATMFGREIKSKYAKALF